MIDSQLLKKKKRFIPEDKKIIKKNKHFTNRRNINSFLLHQVRKVKPHQYLFIDYYKRLLHSSNRITQLSTMN